MITARRDLAAHDLWERSLERSRRRRVLAAQARREVGRRKGVSAAMATAMLASTGAPLAVAGSASAARQAVAAASPANRAIEVKEGGLPLKAGSHGDLVAHVQRALGIDADGVFGPETDAAVRRYQYAVQLAIDGIVGPLTWSSLFAAGSGQASSVGGDVPQGVKDALSQTLQSKGTTGASTSGTQDGELRAVADGGSTSDDGTSGDEALPGGDGNAEAPADVSTPTGNGDGEAQRQPAPEPPAQPLPGTKVGGDCSSASLASPVKGVQTSPYGMRWGRMHEGVDIGAASGTPVHAAACGTVTVRGQQSGYGNIVCITHTNSFATCYAHLSGFAVASGQRVTVGQTIGYVGCTGNCTGPHLHFETRVGGQAQDPRRYLGGATMPGKASTTTAKAATGSAPKTIRRVKQVNAAWSGGSAKASGGAALDPQQAAATPIPTTTAHAALAPADTASAPVQATPAPVAAPAPSPVPDTPAPTPAPTPVETAPVPAPVETPPAEAAPVPAPVEAAPAPTQAAPVQAAPAPTALAPTSQAAPVETAPVQAAPAPAPVETAPAAATPAQAAPAPAAVEATPAPVAATPVEATPTETAAPEAVPATPVEAAPAPAAP